MLQPRAAFANPIRAHGSARKQQTRKIENRIDPIAPSRDESMKIPERFFRPHVQTSFVGKARGQFVDDQCRRDKEK